MDTEKRALLMLIDDQPQNTRLLQLQLGQTHFDFMTAESGEEALGQLYGRLPDLILLDYMMPGMNGYELTQHLKSNPLTRHIPIIMLTALSDQASRLQALSAGVEEFINKPVDQTELWARVRNLLRLKEYQNQLAEHNQTLQQQVAARTRELTEAYRDTIYNMVKAAEYKDEDTGRHVQRISFYCLELADELGLDDVFRDQIFYASPMHDIGKIGIPDAILLNPCSFNAGEWDIMKTHCAVGARILQKGCSPYVQMGAEIALHHHERWDGSGYPNQLSGDHIPLSARLLSICDQYDALRSKRPYKPARSHPDVMQVLNFGDGRTMPSHFDPQVFSAFNRISPRFEEIYQANSD